MHLTRAGPRSGRWVVARQVGLFALAGVLAVGLVGIATAIASRRVGEREAIADLGSAEVVGISKDSVRSHKKFVDKYHLNFTLLSDPEHKVIEAYGSWKPLKFMGREYMGTQRNTFIITPDGKIAKEYVGVDPKTHAAEIIADLKALQNQPSHA